MMTLILTVGLVGYVLAALFAFFAGRDYCDATKARKTEKRAIVDRDAYRKEKDRLFSETMRLTDLLAKAEKSRLEALARIGNQVETIRANEAAIAEMKKNERTFLILQEETNRRIDELKYDAVNTYGYVAQAKELLAKVG